MQAMKEDGAINEQRPFTAHSQTRGNEVQVRKGHSRLAFRPS